MTDAPAKKAAAPANLSRTVKPDVWEQLAAPFPPDQVEKLPKVMRRDDQDRGKCAQGSRYSADGHYCGGYHARAMHLDYVGHAGITMRLNDVVGPDGWNWEPMAFDTDGLPIISREFWIKLTVMGVMKYGVGDDFNGSSKQAIGDALRNAAMRFGIATYLWSKSDAALALKQATDDVEPAPAYPAQESTPTGLTDGERLAADLTQLDAPILAKIQADWPFGTVHPSALNPEQIGQVRAWVQSLLAEPATTDPT